MIDLPEFDVTIPLVRRNPDGTTDTHDVTMRIPAADVEAAQDAAGAISWEVVSHMRQNVGDNNRYGWKRADVIVEPANARLDRVRRVTADLARTGHGHVVPRDDGMLAKCGGPALCSGCMADQKRIDEAKGQ